ncbi:hypothetical protein K503DRAFT_650596, partial [Rhizopogon vinicolor AM-OR11-026]
LDPDVRDRIREEWAVERLHHQEEVVEHTDLENRWRRETKEHKQNLREALRRETQEKGARRAQWATEVEEHERHMNEAIRRENQEKEARRAQWAREVGQHNRDIEERQRREEEERQRLNMFWADPESHTCTSYGTAQAYTARLLNVPPNYNRRIEACMATPIQVHGVEYMAKRCEDHGPNNVIGHWEVNQHEPDCASYWIWYKDYGCISPGSGQRLIEHYLENLPHGSDWREFCATTPASFHGMHFTGAQFCSQKVR